MPERQAKTFRRTIVRVVLFTVALLLVANAGWSARLAFREAHGGAVRFTESYVRLNGKCYRDHLATFRTQSMRTLSGPVIQAPGEPIGEYSLPPWMERAERLTQLNTASSVNTMTQTSIGWPVRMLYYASQTDDTVYRVVDSSGFCVYWPPGYRRVFPLRPIWSGQVVLAAMCFAVVVGAMAFRSQLKRLIIGRRVRRGRCAACNYDLRGTASGVCPECGTRAISRVSVEQADRCPDA